MHISRPVCEFIKNVVTQIYTVDGATYLQLLHCYSELVHLRLELWVWCRVYYKYLYNKSLYFTHSSCLLHKTNLQLWQWKSTMLKFSLVHDIKNDMITLPFTWIMHIIEDADMSIQPTYHYRNWRLIVW